MSSEELAQQAADRVREVIAEAERHADEIVRAAEDEAARIREDAERAAHAAPAAETPSPPVPPPDPSPPGDPVPGPPAPEPAPPPAPEPTPPATANNGAATGDAAVSLMAMKLALDGSGREEIATALEAKFGAADRGALLDDVLARAGR